MEAAVNSTNGEVVEVKVDTFDVETLAAIHPVVAEIIEENKVAISEIIQANTSEEKEVEVIAHFEKSYTSEAITQAIEESAKVDSADDIEPVLIAPIIVESSAFEEGYSVIMTVEMPTDFESYRLTEYSLVCAEFIDFDGNVHIIDFRVVGGKLVGTFPTMGVISAFWIGSEMTNPQI